MKDCQQNPRTLRSAGRRVYELEVCIIGGPLTKRFVQDNPIISRTIEIRGDQALAKLHEAIFEAFDRDDEHMYEFQVGGKGPMDRKARRYVLPMGENPFEDPKPVGAVTRTTVDALGLKNGQVFGYWFDFGDDWWHQINVLSIKDNASAGRYPRVTVEVGQSPPQYIDWDEEDDNEE